MKQRIAELEYMLSKYQDEIVPGMRKRIEELEESLAEWEHIFDMLNDRENRHKYVDWWRKRNGKDELTYPDGDEIYKDFWHLMRIAEKMHLWIFHNTFDEQKAYDECGLTDEDNDMLGYVSFEIRIAEEDKDA